MIIPSCYCYYPSNIIEICQQVIEKKPNLASIYADNDICIVGPSYSGTIKLLNSSTASAPELLSNNGALALLEIKRNFKSSIERARALPD